MELSITRTLPFRRLQDRIGNSTYLLNTVFVGLECVAAGHGEGGALLSWVKPKSGPRARQLADQAKSYTCVSALVLAHDVFDVFLREIVRIQWADFSEEARNIATKAVKKGAKDYTLAERADAICIDLGLDEKVRLAAIDFFAKWRTVAVHSPRPPSVEKKVREILLGNMNYFQQNHSHLDIQLALKNFDARKLPVAKETVSLISIVVKISRMIDESVIKVNSVKSGRMEEIAEAMLAEYFRTGGGSGSSPWGKLSDLCQGDNDRRMKILVNVLTKMGITRNSKPISPLLDLSLLTSIASKTREQLADEWSISKPGLRM